MKFLDELNMQVNASKVGKFFELEERGSNFTTELRGALATFLTMAYILAVNPRILSESGGSCGLLPPFGEDDTEYMVCLEEIKRQYVTATAIGAMFGCLSMGLIGNLPLALAPGMGMNAYFTYSVVGWRGTGSVSYRAALTAVMIEGIILLFLSVTGIRNALLKFFPEPIRLATAPAIGAFLAHLGLQTAEGIGLVVSDIATIVTLGGCPEDKRTPIVAYDELCATEGVCPSETYTCDVEGGFMKSGKTWLGIAGLLVMVILLSYRRRSGILVGIAFVTIISWFRDTAVTYFPRDNSGDARFDYFKQVVSVEPLDKVTAQYTGDLGGIGVALATFLYVDFLDTSGTLLGLVTFMGMIDDKGDFPKSRAAFTADALATMFGSIFGLSKVTSYIESAVGIEAGSRTGLTAVFCSFFFFLSIFFAPILASIPPWATGGALIIVGSLMCRSLKDIQWERVDHAATAFVTIMIMPLTYSIAHGLIGGLTVWFTMRLVFFVLKLAGVKHPDDIEEEESDTAKAEEGNAKKDETQENVGEGSADETEEGDFLAEEAA